MSGPVAVHAAVRAAPAPAPSPAPAGARVLQRCPGGSCADEDELLRREAAGPGPAWAPGIVHEVLASAGRPLDPPVRASLERRLGHDFGSVRVHTDARAAESARAVEALAYTVGRDVVFGAGRYAPGTPAGSRLLAHELAHVVQQRGRASRGGELAVLPAGSALEREADALAAGASTVSPTARPALQRQPPTPASPPVPVCPTAVTISSDPAHVPPCGPLTATADVAGVTWSLEPDPTAVNAATLISTAGAITIAPAQAAGGIKAVATDATGTCDAFEPLRIRSHPTGIASTSVVSQPGAPLYGGRFDHVFTSNDGSVSSLDNVAVGERFIGVPTPAAATHAIAAPLWPFGGTFTLDTATLKPDASDNWFVTSAGGLNGNQDNVTTERSDINVGRFIRSASNPTPPQALPADMTIRQGLHWFCPQAVAASRWRMPGFVTVAHSRTLRDRSGTVEFVTTVNGIEIVEDYDGPVGVFNATPSPVSTPRSPAAGPARTVAITVSTLPAALPTGQTLTFSLVSGPAGSSVAADPANDHGAILTVGTEAGSAVVDAQDSTGTNRARATVTIT